MIINLSLSLSLSLSLLDQITFSILLPTMLSLTVNTPKPLSLSTPFLPHYHCPPHSHKPPNPPTPKALSISALIIPPSSSYSAPQGQQNLYQPFRPPPSPLPPKYRSLDTNGKLEVLADRQGMWFEYAPLITTLVKEGFTPSTLEELTGISSSDQNLLVVGAQVRESLVESTDPETVSFFDPSGFSEILYEIRLLNTPQRAAAARFLIANGFDARRTQELARSMKDFPRRYAERGWDSFDGNLPGDCLAFMYFRQALEHKATSSPEFVKATLGKALEVVESDKARQTVEEELLGKDEGGDSTDLDDVTRVPVVRMTVGEVAEATVVAVLPVCRAEAWETEVEDAPWECGMKGDFGVVEAEKAWTRWVVLPGWEPVAVLRSGGVAVAFQSAKGVLPWKNKRRDVEEEILVVADRGRREVVEDDGFYLVASGGNGSSEQGVKVEKGVVLKEMGVSGSLGTVVLVVRPPREDTDELRDLDWD